MCRMPSQHSLVKLDSTSHPRRGRTGSAIALWRAPPRKEAEWVRLTALLAFQEEVGHVSSVSLRTLIGTGRGHRHAGTGCVFAERV